MSQATLHDITKVFFSLYKDADCLVRLVDGRNDVVPGDDYFDILVLEQETGIEVASASYFMPGDISRCQHISLDDYQVISFKLNDALYRELLGG